MKKTFNPMLFVFILLVSLISCNKNEIFDEPIVEVVEEDIPDTEDTTTDTSLPCDFNLNDVQPDSTIIIDCILDLEGNTISLPVNVTINYEGGDIINGTLNFSENGIIDGNILNSTLVIGGVKPQVKDPVFNFNPERWGIVEGVVSDDIALNNKNILNALFVEAKALGISTFKMDVIDAYFKVSKEGNHLPQWNRGDIFIPSDFTLEMSDNTHLRVQPNSYSFFVLLSVLDATNVTIKGGHLHGDRDEHSYIDYGGATGHGDSALISVNAGVNIVIDNVDMIDSTGDGFIVKSLSFTFDPDYKPSHNVVLKNCVIDNSRRNNISLVNGYDIIIENSEILNAGAPTESSVGTLPKLGLDVEALRSRDEDGNLILYEIVRDVIIRNNIERGSDNGGFLVSIGQDVLFENNDMENYIGYDIATGIKIRNNTFNYTSNTVTNHAIGAAGPGSITTFDNEVSGNTITGFPTGITAYCYGAKIFNNDISNFKTGLFISQLSNTDIYDNTFYSTIENSRGIAAHIASIKNSNIYSNTIEVQSYPVSFININMEPGQENDVVRVNNNTFISPRDPQVSSNSIGVVLENNN